MEEKENRQKQALEVGHKNMKLQDHFTQLLVPLACFQDLEESDNNVQLNLQQHAQHFSPDALFPGSERGYSPLIGKGFKPLTRESCCENCFAKRFGLLGDSEGSISNPKIPYWIQKQLFQYTNTEMCKYGS